MIRVAAVVVFNRSGEMLLVRKRGTSRFMNPGGKPEPGENIRQTAVRELTEELGLAVAAEQLVELGRWQIAAANEPDHDVDATVFELAHPVAEGVRPEAEIEQIYWCRPADIAGTKSLSPLLRGPILDWLERRRAEQ
ncbi:MAG: NUDIX hydrolase [Arachnia propionica]|nr:MAG: NUDIX hydrolase [Arachnia propionica]